MWKLIHGKETPKSMQKNAVTLETQVEHHYTTPATISGHLQKIHIPKKWITFSKIVTTQLRLFIYLCNTNKSVIDFLLEMCRLDCINTVTSTATTQWLLLHQHNDFYCTNTMTWLHQHSDFYCTNTMTWLHQHNDFYCINTVTSTASTQWLLLHQYNDFYCINTVTSTETTQWLLLHQHNDFYCISTMTFSVPTQWLLPHQHNDFSFIHFQLIQCKPTLFYKFVWQSCLTFKE